MVSCGLPGMRATVLASSLSATLEMIREGKVEVQQEDAFAPIWLRSREQEEKPQ